MELEERNDIAPICPHCEEELPRLYSRSLKTLLGRRYIYFCGGCRKILGVSHRKGFFMG
jgi:hypothetical protein